MWGSCVVELCREELGGAVWLDCVWGAVWRELCVPGPSWWTPPPPPGMATRGQKKEPDLPNGAETVS